MPHGEAVAIGLVIETRLAEQMGIARPGTANQVAAVLAALRLPVEAPRGIDRGVLMRAMQSDKKNRDGKVHAAFIGSLGTMAHGDGDSWTQPIDEKLIAGLL
jgi:3-dehydroquinate synthase